MAPKVLIVLTSQGHIDSVNKPTGWFLPELSHPYDVLSAAGVEMTFASPKGGVAPVDPASIEMFKADASSQNFLENHKDLYEKTTQLSTYLGKSGDFDALFYPGGVGPMFDLAHDEQSIALIKEFVAAGKPVSAVCHGPVVFCDVKASYDGKTDAYLLAGKEVAGFSNAEEEIVGSAGYVPFLLEDRIKERGAIYKKAAEPWGECVCTADGGKLITGQNPASAKAVGELILKAIGA